MELRLTSRVCVFPNSRLCAWSCVQLPRQCGGLSPQPPCLHTSSNGELTSSQGSRSSSRTALTVGTFVLMWSWSNSLQSHFQAPARPLARFLHTPLLPSTLEVTSPNSLILLGKLRRREGAKPQSDTVRGCQCRARAPVAAIPPPTPCPTSFAPQAEESGLHFFIHYFPRSFNQRDSPRPPYVLSSENMSEERRADPLGCSSPAEGGRATKERGEGLRRGLPRDSGPLQEVAVEPSSARRVRALLAEGTVVGGGRVHSRNRQKAKWLEVRVRGSQCEARPLKEAVWISC